MVNGHRSRADGTCMEKERGVVIFQGDYCEDLVENFVIRGWSVSEGNFVVNVL